MAKTGIAADSTAVIPKSFWVKLNISLLPLTIPAEGKECVAPFAFYRIIDNSARLSLSFRAVSARSSRELYSDYR